MQGIDVRSFNQADETRPFQGKGYADVVHLADRYVMRETFEPGWRWSENIKPIAGTDMCQASHVGYCLEGRMRVHMNDGSEQDIAPGAVFAIAPGHDAEVIGNDACVLLDFGEAAEYAKRS